MDEVVKPALGSEVAAPLGPKTPVADRENGEFSFALKTLPKPACFDSNPHRLQASVHPESPRTPKDCGFYPFAPGPESMALAPLPEKHLRILKIKAARPLTFDASVSTPNTLLSVSDQVFLEYLYHTLLEVIIPKRRDWDYSEAQTPLAAPRTSGVADTCPPAPRKPAAEMSRDIGLGAGLRRKLF